MKSISARLLVCLLALAFTSFSPTVFALEEACDCPLLKCDPCSHESGVAFYTSKCGPQQSRLKSCARPNCVLIDSPTKQCPVLPKAEAGPREPVAIAGQGPDKVDPNAVSRIVGAVRVIAGSVSIVSRDGLRSVIKGEGKLRETDTLESGANSTALVQFEGGNQLHVHADTAVEVKEYKDAGDKDSRKALLQLIRGKIRNQVHQKYNGKTSFYKVYTTVAVAGVRGTDFVMEHHEGKSIETRVEGLQGRVILASLDEKEARAILRGEGAAYQVAMPDASFKGKDFSEFIQRGKLTPVYKLKADQLRELEEDSRVDVAKADRRPKNGAGGARDVEICSSPKGFFNQCAWTCKNNPPRETTCRVDLPEVGCLRTRCNANGKWDDETRAQVTASPSACPAKGFVVKACDY